jgi:hypothetical protein
LLVKRQQDGKVHAQILQDGQFFAEGSQVGGGPMGSQNRHGMGMKGEDSRQSIGRVRPLHHRANERLVPAVHSVKDTDGQDRFVP